MKTAVMTKPGAIAFREEPLPEPGAGQVRIRIRRIGVCGSDVHVFHGRHPFTTYPVIQGHEFSGLVEKRGPGVKALKPGTLVTAIPQEVCGACAPCRRGDYHICDRLKVRGFQAPGCAREFFVTEADKVVPLPRTFSLEQGALVEPVAVAVHAVARAGLLAGRNVAVLGAGPIGNLVGQAARARGAEVLITDLSPFRLGVARKCGLRHVSNAAREGLAEASRRVFGRRGFDVAFECAGAGASLDAAVSAVAKGGTIVVVGVFGERPRVDVGLVQDRELSLVGTLMYRRPDFVEAVRLMRRGDIATGPLESRHFPFERYLDAYRHVEDKGDRCLKVFVDL